MVKICLPMNSGVLLLFGIKNLAVVSSTYDGCETLIDLPHALICRKIEFVTQRHYAVHDAFKTLSSLS